MRRLPERQQQAVLVQLLTGRLTGAEEGQWELVQQGGGGGSGSSRNCYRSAGVSLTKYFREISEIILLE